MEIHVIIPPHTTAALHENRLATAPVSGPEKITAQVIHTVNIYYM